jgi:hypothetical protein
MNHFDRLEATVQSLRAQLYANESIQAEAESVGLYNGCADRFGSRLP